MSEMQQTTEVAELDVRGFQCPFVLARVVNALSDSPDGELELLSDHPTSVRTTVPAFCSKHGYDLTVTRVEGRLYRLRISRSQT